MNRRLSPYLLAWILLALLLAGCMRPASTDSAGLPSPQASQNLPLASTRTTRSESSNKPALSPTLALTETVTPPSSPTPAARSSRLVFRLPRQSFPPGLDLNGNYQVFLANLDGSGITPLTPRLGGDVAPLDLSQDGEVLVSTGTDLYAATLIPAEPRQLAGNFAGLAFQPNAAGTGRPFSGTENGAYWLAGGGVVYIGLEAGERAIFRVNSDGSGRQRLTRPGDRPAALLPSTDPAGVAWRSCLQQSAVPAAGTPVKPQANKSAPHGGLDCYHWTSLDGTQTHPLWPGAQVAALATQGGMVAYHAANEGGWQAVPVYARDGAGQVAGETEPLNACSLAWSPDGRLLLIGQLFGENFCGWYLLWQPGASELEELPEELPASYAQRWSPDGRSILIEDWGGAWIYELATGGLTPVLSAAGLPTAEGATATHILWAP